MGRVCLIIVCKIPWKIKSGQKSLSCLTQDAGFLDVSDHVYTKFLSVSVQVYV